MILERIAKTRTHRSFTKKRVTMEELEKMLEGARLSSCGRNAQKIRYALITDEELCKKIFPLAKFAGAIPWNPTTEEAPTAYILMCSENPLNNIAEKNLYFDMGIASQNIMLVANELGCGGCIVGAYNRPEVDKVVGLPEGYSSHFLLALGEPSDTVTVTEAINGNITYSRDEENHHFVPKLSLDDISLLKK